MFCLSRHSDNRAYQRSPPFWLQRPVSWKTPFPMDLGWGWFQDDSKCITFIRHFISIIIISIPPQIIRHQISWRLGPALSKVMCSLFQFGPLTKNTTTAAWKPPIYQPQMMTHSLDQSTRIEFSIWEALNQVIHFILLFQNTRAAPFNDPFL